MRHAEEPVRCRSWLLTSASPAGYGARRSAPKAKAVRAPEHHNATPARFCRLARAPAARLQTLRWRLSAVGSAPDAALAHARIKKETGAMTTSSPVLKCFRHAPGTKSAPIGSKSVCSLQTMRSTRSSQSTYALEGPSERWFILRRYSSWWLCTAADKGSTRRDLSLRQLSG